VALLCVVVAKRPLLYHVRFCHRFATRGIEQLHRLASPAILALKYVSV
jgi:hypothetical protein